MNIIIFVVVIHWNESGRFNVTVYSKCKVSCVQTKGMSVCVFFLFGKHIYKKEKRKER